MRKPKIRIFFFKNPQSLHYIWTFDYLYLKNASSEGSKVKCSFYTRIGNLDHSGIRCFAQLFSSKKNVQVAIQPFTKKVLSVKVFERLVELLITTDGDLRGMKQSGGAQTIIDEELVKKVKDLVDSKVLRKQFVSITDIWTTLQIIPSTALKS